MWRYTTEARHRPWPMAGPTKMTGVEYSTCNLQGSLSSSYRTRSDKLDPHRYGSGLLTLAWWEFMQESASEQQLLDTA